MHSQTSAYNDETLSAGKEDITRFPPYPVNMSSNLTLPECILDDAGVPRHGKLLQYHPTTIAAYALAHWNRYLTTGEQHHRHIFLTQAQWLDENEAHIGDASAWPISLPHPDVRDGSWLSATAQGYALSVLARAYRLTGAYTFFAVMRRAVQTFERDILDGGVCVPVNGGGIFFEEVAAYPAAHSLSGFIFALLGLYDYVSLSVDVRIDQRIQLAHTTMHSLLGEFDVGYWTRGNLLHRRLVAPPELMLQAELLDALAVCSDCQLCSTLASRWRAYRRQLKSRLVYEVGMRWTSYRRASWNHVRSRLYPKPRAAELLRVCVPITGFPITGGTRAVLAKVAEVTSDEWKMEYLAQRVGPGSEAFILHAFGTAKMSPWQFPMLWLYFFAGLRKLISLMRQGADYHIILPQDGVFTAAFSGLAGRLAGRRVVCIDHGNLTLLKSKAYRLERMQALVQKRWPHPLLARFLMLWYWPSLHLMARLSAHCVDHFLVPGVAGDGVEKICEELGVPASRLTRFASMIDAHRYGLPDEAARAIARRNYGVHADAIVIAMVCRLSPAKGLDIALESISQAISALAPEVRERVHIIIAGDGPLRTDTEEAISIRGLSRTCVLWGETSPSEIISLLGLSDIFLYTSIRGACISMAVLEAMASGCAVVASTRPLSNAHLLAEGRGIAVPPGDVSQTSEALVRLVMDLELCGRMGRLARDYVEAHHDATTFKRVLTRATYWSGLDELLKNANMTMRTTGKGVV